MCVSIEQHQNHKLLIRLLAEEMSRFDFDRARGGSLMSEAHFRMASDDMAGDA